MGMTLDRQQGGWRALKTVPQVTAEVGHDVRVLTVLHHDDLLLHHCKVLPCQAHTHTHTHTHRLGPGTFRTSNQGGSGHRYNTSHHTCRWLQLIGEESEFKEEVHPNFKCVHKEKQKVSKRFRGSVPSLSKEGRKWVTLGALGELFLSLDRKEHTSELQSR